MSYYASYNYEVKFIFSDNEFGPLKGRIREKAKAELNLAAPAEHVPEVENNIGTIKERVRSTLAGMPYKKVPRHFKRELVLSCVSMLNVVPRAAGASESLSPMELLTGRTLDYKKHCQLAPGAYCLVHEDLGVQTNSMKERALGAIAIGPTSNIQGSYRFLSLKSGEIITRRTWDVLPATPEVEEKVHAMAGENGDMTVAFSYRGVSYSTAAPLAAAVEPDGAVAPDDDNVAAPQETAIAEVNEGEGDVVGADKGVDENEIGEVEEALVAGEDPPDDVDAPAEPDEINIPDEMVEDVDEGVLLQEELESSGGPATNTRSSMRNDRRQFLWRLGDKGEGGIRQARNEQQFLADWQIGEVFTQFSLNRGLKLFGEKAEKGVMKELRQFVEKDVLRPVSIDKLTPEKMKNALRLIMTVKEKRDGTYKGRGCADGSGQRGLISVLEAMSPTVSSEGLNISCAIDASEGRYVVTVDIPGAYLHCDMDTEEYVLLEGVLVDLYLKVNPSAKSKVSVGENGKKRLFTRMNKALYGHMRSGRLFFEHISATLKGLGFAPNPDDLCVWNKTVDGKQFTIVLYVDDLKLSFHSREGVDEVIAGLEKVYGKLDPKRVKVFDYCGITLDYRTKGVCKISAPSYIDSAIADYEKVAGKIRKGAKTPAQTDLFKVSEDSTALDEDRRKVFYSVFARLLWVGVKARPDALVALSFLGKRTSKADEDDWVKLERLLSYLQDTRDLPLTLGIDNLHVIKWWADSSFAVHEDMKSHSGILGSLGRGAIFARSVTQKLNTTSSTESEVVAGSEALVQALWTTSFLKHQGYDVKNALLHQDNLSAMALQNHGVLSRRRRTRHIDIRFFFSNTSGLWSTEK